VALARPVLGARVVLDDHDAVVLGGMPPDDLERAVRAAVEHEDQLEVVVLLVTQGRAARIDDAFLVVRGDDHAHLRGRLVAVPGVEIQAAPDRGPVADHPDHAGPDHEPQDQRKQGQREQRPRDRWGHGGSVDSAAMTRPVYVLDRDAVRAVDRAAIEEYGIPGIVLMENAARALAATALSMLDGGGMALIICGSGNNGGDGWALARHLHNAGVRVVVAPLGDPRPDGDAGVNCAICRAMGIEEIAFDRLEAQRDADLIVDAIFGTGLTRPVLEGRAEEAIVWMNAGSEPVLAVDVPSGLDADRGFPLGVAVRATATVTFVGMKPGFLVSGAEAWTGTVTVGDIGAPRELTERYGRPLEGG
jgi:NAD(P)H-hydrate epimerase